MAGPAPNTRNWHALENAHKPKGLHILVFGEVEVSATNKEPRLTETAERNPKNLGLNLTIAKSGKGTDVTVWKPAHFHKVVNANQYDNVVVRWDVSQIANFPVRDDREHFAEAAEAVKTLNQRHAVKGKATKPAAKKPAAKKAAAKKVAPKKSAAKAKPRSVGGWAKGKKAKKKAPKKAARKSGLKKLVRKLVKKLRPAKKKRR